MRVCSEPYERWGIVYTEHYHISPAPLHISQLIQHNFFNHCGHIDYNSGVLLNFKQSNIIKILKITSLPTLLQIGYIYFIPISLKILFLFFLLLPGLTKTADRRVAQAEGVAGQKENVD